MNSNRITRRPRRRGATLLLICFLTIFLVGLIAFGVDIGRMFLVRSQLQTAVDSGALAAALCLRDNPNDVSSAEAAAHNFVQQNRVGSLVTLPTNAIVVESGIWNPNSETFAASTAAPNSVRVSARVNDELLYFAGVFNRKTFSLPRAAIASGTSIYDIVLTLDLSGSMGANGRIQALQSAAPEFVNVIDRLGDDDRIAVMGYGALVGMYDPIVWGDTGQLYQATPNVLYPSDPEEWVAVLEAGLTSDFEILRDDVLSSSALEAGKYYGWTPIGAGLRDSVHYLDSEGRENAQKVIVLMSDGLANKPNNNATEYARDMAEYAAQSDIKVFTISLGNSADEELMQEIADLTGGEHIFVPDANSVLTANLTAAFRRIANTIKRTQLVQ